MKTVFHKIGAVSMAFVVLFSTLSFTADLHICGGSVVDVSFTQEKLSCSATLMGELSDEAHNAMREMGCCDDLQLQIEGQDELQHSSETPQVDNLTFLFVVPPTPDILSLENPGDTYIISSYIPPPLIGDIHILYQTFLL